jgi:hypothetical protein
MMNASFQPAEAAFEHGDRLGWYTKQLPVIVMLLPQSVLSILGRDPFRAMAAIGRDEAFGNAVAVEFCACVVTNRFEPDSSTGYAQGIGIKRCKLCHVINKQRSAFAIIYASLIEMLS